MTHRIGMIGDGNVGTALTQGLTRAGHEVRAVGREPPKVKEIGQWADTIVLAVPFPERENAIRELGESIRGKTLIDVTNALGPDQGLAVDPRRESGAEGLQKMAQDAQVVKAFNTVFAQHMDKGTLHGQKLSVLVAGDNERAKRDTIQLARDIGFDAIDAGPLQNARWLETLGFLNIQLGYNVGHGPAIGFKLVHEPEPGAAPERAKTGAKAGQR